MQPKILSQPANKPVILNVCKLSNEDEDSSNGNTPKIRNLSRSGYELSESQKTAENSSSKKDDFVDWHTYIRNNEGKKVQIFKASSFRKQKGGTVTGNENKVVAFSPINTE